MNAHMGTKVTSRADTQKRYRRESNCNMEENYQNTKIHNERGKKK